MIQKPKVNPLDTIIACHGNLFYHGEMKYEIPNLRGLGTHYHDLNFAWIDFDKSTFNLVRDSGAFITENHQNGHLYWLDTKTDVFNNVFALDSFLLDSTDGSWRGFREDTLSKKNVLKRKHKTRLPRGRRPLRVALLLQLSLRPVLGSFYCCKLHTFSFFIPVSRLVAQEGPPNEFFALLPKGFLDALLTG